MIALFFVITLFLLIREILGRKAMRRAREHGLWRSVMDNSFFRPELDYLRSTVKEDAKEIRRTIERKKKNFLGGPWRFYYIDRDEVDSLHNQITPVMRITEKEIEKVGETSKGVSAEIPIVKPSYEKKGSKKERKKMEPRQETSEMKYDLILKHLIDSKIVAFDIEEFVYDDTSEKVFEAKIGKIEKAFNYSSPDHIQFVQGFIQFNRKRKVDEKVKKIKHSQGKFALVQGDFTVSKSGGDGFLLTCIHPISETFGIELTLSVHCTKSCMTRFGAETFSRMGKINARIFGTVTLFDEKAGTIDIDPITIH